MAASCDLIGPIEAVASAMHLFQQAIGLYGDRGKHHAEHISLKADPGSSSESSCKFQIRIDTDAFCLIFCFPFGEGFFYSFYALNLLLCQNQFFGSVFLLSLSNLQFVFHLFQLRPDLSFQFFLLFLLFSSHIFQSSPIGNQCLPASVLFLCLHQAANKFFLICKSML